MWKKRQRGNERRDKIKGGGEGNKYTRKGRAKKKNLKNYD